MGLRPEWSSPVWRSLLKKLDTETPLDRSDIAALKQWRKYVRDMQRANGFRPRIPRGGFLLRSRRLLKKAGMGVDNRGRYVGVRQPEPAA